MESQREKNSPWRPRRVIRLLDNERGKGDHRHQGAAEQPHRFVDVPTLLADFMADVERAG